MAQSRGCYGLLVRVTKRCWTVTCPAHRLISHLGPRLLFPISHPPKSDQSALWMQNQHIAPRPHMQSLSNYYFRFQVFVGAAVYGCYKESFSQAALVAAAIRSLPSQRPPQISSSAHIRICRLTFTVIAVLFERQRSPLNENAPRVQKCSFSSRSKASP
jgi:hypothetical protein